MLVSVEDDVNTLWLLLVEFMIMPLFLPTSPPTAVGPVAPTSPVNCAEEKTRRYFRPPGCRLPD